MPDVSRVTTSDGRAIFVLQETLIFLPGDTAAFGYVLAKETGASQNGPVPGQINLLIDLVPYIAATANTTASLFDPNAEDDDHWLERIGRASESFSCAGPVGA